MADTVDVVISVRPETARILQDPSARARAVGDFERLVRQQAAADLGREIERFSADARARGLTDRLVDEELAADKAERLAGRGQTPA
jgi:hypothetical protein